MRNLPDAKLTHNGVRYLMRTTSSGTTSTAVAASQHSFLPTYGK